MEGTDGGLGRAETRVLEKAVALAQLMAAQRARSGRGESFAATGADRRAERQRLLLAAVLRVSAAVGALGPVVMESERVLDAAVLLARFSYAQAAQLLRGAGGRDAVGLAAGVYRRWALRRALGLWRRLAAQSVGNGAPADDSDELPGAGARLRAFLVRAEMRAALRVLCAWRRVVGALDGGRAGLSRFHALRVDDAFAHPGAQAMYPPRSGHAHMAMNLNGQPEFAPHGGYANPALYPNGPPEFVPHGGYANPVGYPDGQSTYPPRGGYTNHAVYSNGQPTYPPQGGTVNPMGYSNGQPTHPPQGGYANPVLYSNGQPAYPPQAGYANPAVYPSGQPTHPPQSGYANPMEYPNGQAGYPITGGYARPASLPVPAGGAAALAIASNPQADAHFQAEGDPGAHDERRPALRTWRGLLRLRRGTAARGGAVATLYDGIRVARPALRRWLAALAAVSFAGERAAGTARSNQLGASFGAWRSAFARRGAARSALRRWRARAVFCRAADAQAGAYARRRTAAAAFTVMRSAHVRSRTRQNMVAHVLDRGCRVRALRALRIWQGVLRWVGRQSDKVRTLRAARDAAACLAAWRAWREARATADALRRVSVLAACVDTWRAGAADRASRRDAARAAFARWRQLTRTRPAMRAFFRQPPDVQIADAAYACVLFRVGAPAFAAWRQSFQLCRAADAAGLRFERRRLCAVFRAWRLEARGLRVAAQRPQKAARAVLRAAAAAVSTAALERAARCDAYACLLLRRRVVAALRAWRVAIGRARARQAQLRSRAALLRAEGARLALRQWKLGTARRMLARCDALRRARVVLAAWRTHRHRDAAQAAALARHRALLAWRSALRASVLRDHLLRIRRAALRRVLPLWRRAARTARESHARSTAFIGANAARFCLQRWRTEAALRRSPGAALPELLASGEGSFVAPPLAAAGAQASGGQKSIGAVLLDVLARRQGVPAASLV